MVQGLKPGLAMNIIKGLFVAIVVVVALSGCNKRKEIVLQKEVDSLRVQVSISRQSNATLQKDKSETYVASYVDSIESRSDAMERELKKGTGTTAIYADIIARLKASLIAKSLELNAINEQVALQKGLTDTLRMIVEQQAAEIDSGAAILAATKQELLQIDKDVKQFSSEAKYQDPNSLDERASALEQMVKRTQQAIERSKSF